MKQLRRSTLLVFTALAATLAGCAGLFRQPDEISVSEVRRLNQCNSASGAAAVTLLDGLDALRDWQQARGVDFTVGAPLPQGPFAVVELGTRNTGGYGIAVSRVAYLEAGVLTLNASFLVPSSELRAQIITSPCVLVALPVGNYRVVELLDPAGSRRAISSEPPLPQRSSAPAQ